MNPSPLCVIMQPTYLSWMGYFDLMDQADVFVYLDDVQFSKQSWQQRNRIRMSHDLGWLSVPVNQKMGQLIRDAEIKSSTDFPQKHIKSVEMNYARAPHFKKYFKEFSEVLTEGANTGKLVDLNIILIEWVAKQLQITTPRMRSSTIRVDGERSNYIVNICDHVKSKRYLSPEGAVVYLHEDRHLFEGAGIEVKIQKYAHPVWNQVYQPFIPYCSAIDLIFNNGENSREILLSGRKPSAPLAEAIVAFNTRLKSAEALKNGNT